ncbi:MAG: hypothetical protein WAN16_11410 [Chthoniobacterales bacterium]
MTPDKIKRAIAEACGWKRPDDTEVMKWKIGWIDSEDWWMCPKGVLRLKCDIPDYCNDLNAMHEAEKVLTSEQVTSYVDLLEFMNERWATPAFGTAAQRAEAFLRTLGKWEDDK